MAKRSQPGEFYFVAAIVAFVWLFLFGGVYNAITLRPVEDRSPSDQRIVWLISFLDDGDESLYVPKDIRYTATLIAVPVAFALLGFACRLRNER